MKVLKTDLDRELLRRLQIDFEEVTIRPEQIDLEKSKNTQERIIARPVDDKHVEELALSMIDGVPFPPITVKKLGMHSYLVLSGLHRVYAAKEAELPEIGAYVISDRTSDTMISKFSIAANAALGARPSTDQRLLQAIDLVQRSGVSIVEAAATANVSRHVLSERLRRIEGRMRLAKLKISDEVLKRVADTATMRLGAVPDDKVLEAAVRAIDKYKLTISDIDPMVRELRKLHSREAALAWLTEQESTWCATTQHKIKGGPTRAPQSGAIRAVRSALGILRNAKAKPFLTLGKKDREAFATDFLANSEHLKRLAKQVAP